ncbi:MAG: M20 family metallopeptidase [Acidimicrobiales bacterium]
MDVERAKQAVTERIDSLRGELLDVSHHIWEHPELCFEEHDAHDLLTGVLDRHGFAVERGACGLDTAFVGRAGDSGAGPTVAVLCEYDALPEIGHACGHNIIAAAGLGAALGAAAVADQLGGRLVVMGTPAEEGGGGKIAMIDAGAFEGVDAALMVHPADADLNSFWAIAIHELHVEYHGLAAHAAAAPEKGRNALDAAVLGYMNIAALRQHIGGSERIHGIFTHGGDKPNIVPHRASMQWYVRSTDIESLEALKARVLDALQAGALATGCTMTYEWPNPAYEELVPSGPLDALYAANAAALGREVRPREERPEFMGSTDMGNVSHLVPSLHPMIKAAPDGVAIHTAEFATHTGGPLGDAAVIDGAIAMAHTIVDLWASPEVLQTARGSLS